MATLAECCEAHRSELMAMPNVVAVGIGTKRRGGIDTGEPCIVVIVTEKIPGFDRPVPTSLEEHLTDVLDGGGPPRALAIADHRISRRPVVGGISVGPKMDWSTGTIGLPLVYKSGEPHLLSNRHVLAVGLLPVGTPIVQPGLLDGGDVDKVVARLSGIAPLDLIDAAIAALTMEARPELLGLGPYTTHGEAALNMAVTKSGRTTGVTSGQVVAAGVVVDVQYPDGIHRLQDQVAISGVAFMQGGDSGAAVVETSTGRVVGLGFAASDSMAYANRIQNVLDYFGLTLQAPGQPVAVAFAPILDKLSIVWGFENALQAWRHWQPDAPDYANDLKCVIAGRAYWVGMWEGAAFQGEPLYAGWNLIALK